MTADVALATARKNDRVITDGRGRSVALLDPIAMHLFGRCDAVPAEPLRVIAEEIEPAVAKRPRLKILLYVFLILLFLGLHFVYNIRGTVPGTFSLRMILTSVGGSIPIIVPFLFVIIAQHRLYRGSFNRVAPVMLKHRRCPHCGYDLRGLPVAQEDHATVCPECGCAWQVDDTAIAEALEAVATERAAAAARKKPIIVVCFCLLLASSVAGVCLLLWLG